MLWCMRTTIDLNDELLRKAKRLAANEGVTLKDIVERAVRTLVDRKQTARAYRLRWRTEGGKRPPAVPIEDRRALLDFMEGR